MIREKRNPPLRLRHGRQVRSGARNGKRAGKDAGGTNDAAMSQKSGRDAGVTGWQPGRHAMKRSGAILGVTSRRQDLKNCNVFAIRILDLGGASRRVTGWDLWVAADGAGRGELCVTATAYDNRVVNSCQVIEFGRVGFKMGIWWVVRAKCPRRGRRSSWLRGWWWIRLGREAGGRW